MTNYSESKGRNQRARHEWRKNYFAAWKTINGSDARWHYPRPFTSGGCLDGGPKIAGSVSICGTLFRLGIRTHAAVNRLGETGPETQRTAAQTVWNRGNLERQSRSTRNVESGRDGSY